MTKGHHKVAVAAGLCQVKLQLALAEVAIMGFLQIHVPTQADSWWINKIVILDNSWKVSKYSPKHLKTNKIQSSAVMNPDWFVGIKLSESFCALCGFNFKYLLYVSVCWSVFLVLCVCWESLHSFTASSGSLQARCARCRGRPGSRGDPLPSSPPLCG